MPRIVYVTCPHCGRQFYVGREFFEVEESYCHCPYCGEEFKPKVSSPREISAQVRLPGPADRGS